MNIKLIPDLNQNAIQNLVRKSTESHLGIILHIVDKQLFIYDTLHNVQ